MHYPELHALLEADASVKSIKTRRLEFYVKCFRHVEVVPLEGHYGPDSILAKSALAVRVRCCPLNAYSYNARTPHKYPDE